MSYNVEALIGTVSEMFYEMTPYLEVKNWHSLSQYERTYMERNYHWSERELWSIAQILNIDIKRLYMIEKSIRKWHEKTDWMISFPYEKHADKIRDYLKKDRDDIIKPYHIRDKPNYYLDWQTFIKERRNASVS